MTLSLEEFFKTYLDHEDKFTGNLQFDKDNTVTDNSGVFPSKYFRKVPKDTIIIHESLEYTIDLTDTYLKLHLI